MSASRLPSRLASARLVARSSTAPLARAAFSTGPTSLKDQPTTPQRAPPTATPTGLPGANVPSGQKYSPLTVSVVTSLAKLFGYHSQTSTAIRTASDYYDRCAERAELEAPFFYEGEQPLVCPGLCGRVCSERVLARAGVRADFLP